VRRGERGGDTEVPEIVKKLGKKVSSVQERINRNLKKEQYFMVYQRGSGDGGGGTTEKGFNYLNKLPNKSGYKITRGKGEEKKAQKIKRGAYEGCPRKLKKDPLF